MTDTKDKNQTPAPKVSSGKDTSEKKGKELKSNIDVAERGAKAKTTATKTPAKIQEGKN